MLLSNSFCIALPGLRHGPQAMPLVRLWREMPPRPDLDTDAAVFGRVIDFCSAQPKRMLHALNRGQIGDSAPAANDDVLRPAPVGEAAGITSRAAMMRR